MDRVRIGLTGLAFVFLLVLAAAAFFGVVRHEPDLSGNSSLIANNGEPANAQSPKEPLAELGVTPGNMPDKPVPATAPPAAAATHR